MQFAEIYDNRPDKKEHGSSGYSNMRNLYDLCVELKPRLIVESGTWKGNSSWLFYHFAPVVCHDLQFYTLMWRSPEIEYIKEDIENYTYPQDTLFYFDDHISQRKRLEWLIAGEYRHAIFDDNHTRAEIEDIKIKNPATPTLAELMENDDPLVAHISEYRIMPKYPDGKRDTKLTYIEL